MPINVMAPSMLSEGLHRVLEGSVRCLEFAGAGIIIGGTVLSIALYLMCGFRTNDWASAYVRLRSNLGRGILLGLELLVGADIISTISAPLTIESVGLLGAIIVIRTFLSFSLETEIEGCWPWERAAKKERRTEAADCA